jgi:hypothetical protein
MFTRTGTSMDVCLDRVVGFKHQEQGQSIGLILPSYYLRKYLHVVT